MSKNWFVYIIRASDQRLYTGITIDMERRWSEHCDVNGSNRGAKFFRGRKPEALVFIKDIDSRSVASREESAIKKLSKEQKLLLISSNTNKISKYPKLWGL